MKTKVYPTSDASLNLSHPIDGKLVADGSFWEYDGFTCRMLSDGAVSIEAPRTPPKPAASSPSS